jgi:hypothetical protein
LNAINYIDAYIVIYSKDHFLAKDAKVSLNMFIRHACSIFMHSTIKDRKNNLKSLDKNQRVANLKSHLDTSRAAFNRQDDVFKAAYKGRSRSKYTFNITSNYEFLNLLTSDSLAIIGYKFAMRNPA